MSELLNRGIDPRASLEAFAGFPDFRANVLYCPKQFFTIVIPHSSVNCIRIVGYMLRKTLGYLDEDGNPLKEQHAFTFSELIEKAGISRGGIRAAIDEALKGNFIRRVKKSIVQTKGVRAKSASYELLWDEENYTDDPSSFNGFHLATSYLNEEGKSVAGRKNIPNLFFDHTIRTGSRGLIRVVGTLLWYSIQFGKGGERRQPVTKSLREIVSLTNLDKSSVVRALDEAERTNHIVREERGVIDLSGKGESSSTRYAIRWVSVAPQADREPLKFQVVTGKRYKNATQPLEPNGTKTQHKQIDPTVQKRNTGEQYKNATQDGTKTQREERYKNATYKGINNKTINTSINNSSTLAAVVKELQALGFDEKTSSILAPKTTLEVVKNQAQALSRRQVSKNRLGLLRKAIEENWEIPTTDVGSSQETVFASYFYAGFAGSSDAPVSLPSTSDVQAVEKLVPRLIELSGKSPEVLGRDFGAASRRALKKDAQANLSWCVRVFGDRFLKSVRAEAEAKKAEEEMLRLVEIEEQKRPEYQRYVLGVVQESRAGKYWTEFDRERQEKIAKLQLDGKKLGVDMRSAIESLKDDGRFEEYLKAKGVIADFWTWNGGER